MASAAPERTAGAGTGLGESSAPSPPPPAPASSLLTSLLPDVPVSPPPISTTPTTAAVTSSSAATAAVTNIGGGGSSSEETNGTQGVELSRLWELCKKEMAIPPETRAKLWNFLLSRHKPGTASTPLQQEGMAAIVTESCFSDAQRALHFSELQKVEPKAQQLIAQITTQYCAKCGTPYHLSSREVVCNLSVAIISAGIHNEDDAVSCLTALASKYLPHVLPTLSSPLILGLSQMLTLLLMYHDPQLAIHLRHQGFQCSTFPRDWMCNLFAGSCATLGVFICLLDYFLLADDHFAFILLACSVVLSMRNEIMGLKTSNQITDLLRSFSFTEATLKTILVSYKKISVDTPTSFKKQVHATMTHTPHFEKWIDSYSKTSLCIQISALDLALDKKHNGFHYFICDCRPTSHFKAGSLPTAYHFNPINVQTPQRIQDLVSQIRIMVNAKRELGKTLHVTLCGVGSHEPNSPGYVELQSVLVAVLKAGITNVSIFRRGFEAIHDLYLTGKIELAAHDADNCPECTRQDTWPDGEVLAAEIAQSISNTGKSFLHSISTKLPQFKSPLAVISKATNTPSTPQPPQQGVNVATKPSALSPSVAPDSKSVKTDPPKTPIPSSEPTNKPAPEVKPVSLAQLPPPVLAQPEKVEVPPSVNQVSPQNQAAPTAPLSTTPPSTTNSSSTQVSSTPIGEIPLSAATSTAPSTMFSLFGEDEDEQAPTPPIPKANTTTTTTEGEPTPPSGAQLSTWTADSNNHLFPIQPESPGTKGYLVVNSTSLIWLRQSNSTSLVTPAITVPLSDLDKISMKKLNPKLLIFRFKTTPERQVIAIDDPKDIIKTVSEITSPP